VHEPTLKNLQGTCERSFAEGRGIGIFHKSILINERDVEEEEDVCTFGRGRLCFGPPLASV